MMKTSELHWFRAPNPECQIVKMSSAEIFPRMPKTEAQKMLQPQLLEQNITVSYQPLIVTPIL